MKPVRRHLNSRIDRRLYLALGRSTYLDHNEAQIEIWGETCNMRDSLRKVGRWE